MTTEQDISAMHDSVSVINDRIENCLHSQDEHDEIERNVGHLELMLTKEHIINDTSDKSAFHSAIAAGRKHLA